MKSSQSRRYKRNKKRTNNKWARLLVTCVTLVGVIFLLHSAITVNVADFSVVTVEVGESYRQEISATWFGLDITKFGKFEGSVDTNKIGSYYLSYIPPFNLKKCSIVVNVKDTKAPTITLLGESEVLVESIEKFEDPGCTAVDNYDGVLTECVQVERRKIDENKYQIVYSVTDASGNSNSTTRTVTLQKGIVYLTFDDGPSLDCTPQILEILERNNVNATFFVIGFGENKYDLIKQIYEEGNTIGYHGYSHDYGKVYQSVDTVIDNFHKVEELVMQVTGSESSMIVRFPGGSSNTVSKKYCTGVMTQATKQVIEEGYVYFDWNVDSQDAGGAKTAEEVYQNVISGIKPGRNVVLMHDFSGNQKTVDALQKIIDFCKNNNYEIRVIDENTVPIQHNVAN